MTVPRGLHEIQTIHYVPQRFGSERMLVDLVTDQRLPMTYHMLWSCDQ